MPRRSGPRRPRNLAFRYRRGDAAGTQAALASAAHVVEIDLVNNRIAAAAHGAAHGHRLLGRGERSLSPADQRGLGAPDPPGIGRDLSASRSTGWTSPARMSAAASA